MGLDMHLEVEIYLSQYTGGEEKKADKIRKMFPAISKTGDLDFVKVSFEAGYWRKANHIHKWFVDNVQSGEDDCGIYYVEREKLKELLELCRNVLKVAKTKKTKEGIVITNPKEVAELLPTQEGFFFGSTDYDGQYLEDVKRTIEIIKRCFELPDDYGFKYHSSW